MEGWSTDHCMHASLKCLITDAYIHMHQRTNSLPLLQGRSQPFIKNRLTLIEQSDAWLFYYVYWKILDKSRSNRVKNACRIYGNRARQLCNRRLTFIIQKWIRSRYSNRAVSWSLNYSNRTFIAAYVKLARKPPLKNLGYAPGCNFSSHLLISQHAKLILALSFMLQIVTPKLIWWHVGKCKEKKPEINSMTGGLSKRCVYDLWPWRWTGN